LPTLNILPKRRHARQSSWVTRSHHGECPFPRSRNAAGNGSIHQTYLNLRECIGNSQCGLASRSGQIDEDLRPASGDNAHFANGFSPHVLGLGKTEEHDI
jgi:hypothetical protein